MTKFKNKYRVESHRRPNWDYSSNALYFLTIVTQHRVCNLGKIENNEMILSDFGSIVETEWHKSFDIRKELFLDEFVLMPNHLHAIVEIRNPNRVDLTEPVETDRFIDTDDRVHQQLLMPSSDTDDRVHQQLLMPSSDTDDRPYLQSPILSNEPMPPIKRNPPIRLPQSISSFIAGFKSSVNSKIDDYIDEKQLNMQKYNRNNHFFQPNYHDHIIRNEREYQWIKNYIANNPFNWEKDTFNNTNNGAT